METHKTLRWSVLLAWIVLLIVAGACVNLAAPPSVSAPTTTSPTAVVDKAPGFASEPTEVLAPTEPAANWRQEGSSQLLEIPSCFDFDEGIISGAPDPACDINFLAGKQPESVDIYPTSGAQIGPAAPEVERALVRCVDLSSMSGDPVTLSPPMDESAICFETAEGKLGLLSIVNADLHTAYSVTFDWWTFDPAEPVSSSPKDSSPLAYSNDSFGFQLTFPASWDGYSVKELDGSGVGSVCFSFGGPMPVCVLQIDVYTHAQWAQLQKLHDGYYLGENDYYVFGAGPFTEECVQMDEFQCERYHELPGILASFAAD